MRHGFSNAKAMRMIAIYASILILSFIVSLLGTLVARRISRHLHFFDHPEARKIHREPTPLGGGLAIFFSALATMTLGFLIAHHFYLQGSPSWVPSILRDNLEGITSIMPRVWAILAGSLALVVMGLIDDRFGIHPKAKFILQILVATFLVFAGVRVTVYQAGPILSGLITIGWIVLITNSFNLLDNMDGLASGVAIIIASIFLVVSLQSGQVFVASLLLVLIGAVLGFLVFNFPPASIFMGDAGSLFIGFLLAVSTVVFTFARAPDANPIFPILMPLTIFLVPLYDTASVIIIRLRQKRSIFQADMSHFSHRLVKLGMTARETVLTIYLVTFSLSLAATILYFLDWGPSLIVLLQAFSMIALVAILERPGKRGNTA